LESQSGRPKDFQLNHNIAISAYTSLLLNFAAESPTSLLIAEKLAAHFHHLNNPVLNDFRVNSGKSPRHFTDKSNG